MGRVWDVFTGRIPRFVTERNKALRDVCIRLTSWTNTTGPQLGDSAIVIRNRLYTYYFAATGGLISTIIDTPNSDLYRHRLNFMGLSAGALNNLVCATHCHNLVLTAEFTTIADDGGYQTRNEVLCILMSGVVWMYNRPEGYGKAWLDLFFQHEESSEKFALVSAMASYNEIATIMGLDPNDFSGAGRWGQETLFLTNLAQNLYEKPGFCQKIGPMISSAIGH